MIGLNYHLDKVDKHLQSKNSSEWIVSTGTFMVYVTQGGIDMMLLTHARARTAMPISPGRARAALSVA